MHLGELSEDNFYPKRTTWSATWKLEIEKVYATPKKRIALYISFIFIIDSCILHPGMHQSLHQNVYQSVHQSILFVSANEDMHLHESRLQVRSAVAIKDFLNIRFCMHSVGFSSVLPSFLVRSWVLLKLYLVVLRSAIVRSSHVLRSCKSIYQQH